MNDPGKTLAQNESLPEIRMSRATYDIYRAMRERSRQELHDMLTSRNVNTAIKLSDRNGNETGILRYFQRPTVDDDGRIDYSKVNVGAELILKKILQFRNDNVQIKMPAAVGLPIAEKAANHRTDASLALLYDLIDVPDSIKNSIRPQITRWVYLSDIGVLRAIYCESYRYQIPFSHSRLFPQPA